MTTKKVKSVCPYCGVGCGIVLEVSDNRVVKVTGDKEHPANFGRLCTKGSSCAEAITESGRMEYAYRRNARGQKPIKVGIDETISETAQRLRAILDKHGPDALSFYVSGQMSLEAQYLINKLAKGYVRTNNIESNSRLCMASAGTGYKLSLGSDGPPGSYQDIEKTNLFFVIGANMADCHPILFLRVMDRLKAGAKMIVVDPRRNTTADKASLYLQIKPGTDLALLNGILHLLVKNGHTDPDFIAQFTSGWENMAALLEDYTPDKVAEITGLAEADIRQAALWIGESPEWMSCWTMGLNQSTHGTWHTNAICNLHLATGKICRPGSGPFSLTGQPNAMGGREMGYMGPGLPGQRSVLVEADRRFIEDLWSVPQGTLRTEVGSGTISMFESMQAGDIKACWIICTNPVATVPNRKNVIAGLQKAELVITQDAFFETETNSYADIMLPGALWSESEGVMINSERNLTLAQKAVEPPGETLPDWQIIARVACEMGFSSGFSYASSAEVYLEIQQAWNPKSGYDIRGASYERLREAPIQWPCAPGSPNQNPIRYLNNGFSQTLRVDVDGSSPRIVFPTESGKGMFWARPYLPPHEMPDNEYPLVLNTGRLQHQWHTMTKTGKIPKLNKLNPGPFIEIHAEDAAALGILNQDPVEIRSRRGLAILPAVVTDRVRPGNCFAPFHWNDVFGNHLAINDVTSDAIDPISFQPEFKFCSVSIVRAEVNKVAVPIPAVEAAIKQKEVVHMAQMDTLASILGIESYPPLTLNDHEKIYVSGLITSLRTKESLQSPGIPVLPPTAPLEPAKRIWLDGLLAGLFSRTYLPEPVASEITTVSTQIKKTAKTPVTIVWASQTGNAEDAAQDCAHKLRSAGHDTRLVNMNEYPLTDLSQERFVLFVTSTFGAGDPPDNGEYFWRSLNTDHAPGLSNLHYAVLAFGDSNFDQFCGFGRNLDTRLEQLGAQRFYDCVDCDTDFEEQVESWIMAIETALDESASQPVAVKALDPIKSTEEAEISKKNGYDRDHPLHTQILTNRLLSRDNSEKETRHYVFNLKDTDLQFEAGDALGVWPSNCPELIDELLTATQLQPSVTVTLKEHGETPLYEAMLRHLDITRITPAMLQFIQEHTNSSLLGDLLKKENKNQLQKWLWGRQLIDLLQEFPVSASAQDFITMLKPMQPRLYSISSSPNANPDEVHVTVSTVRYEYNGKIRKGVCSTFLADQAMHHTEIPIFIQRSAHFRPPANPDVPMIMVGPGTGVGPFRGFLQERQAISAKGRNWLIFGEQREDSDFYFKEELDAIQKDGYLHRLDTAFSRDQDEKIYVQHRMLEHGAELWSWLAEGAHFYVCGDANRMAKEVDTALKKVIQVHGGMNADEAEGYVREMSQSKRYSRDVY
ncbi:bifunctional nitrate reductase/sulfite reductase flavoprotein subunit alpha [Paenibacillus wynnii]|uniref:bifunctional nitrate reductase/sulfite reductase flavoprotein subunit alpha n=1 Tax=Paenibacillus wynnii TaxID=268407 RepID=UPI002792AB49|nr:bifunctional nitrate reductase/sulfite reductase flavoprotein subunit alpha [Paenibacillus wynnii]MDQ0193037.1 sulfite reductase (NADPH) flavoprotein alpha-component [Paenibacillus wynnii]